MNSVGDPNEEVDFELEEDYFGDVRLRGPAGFDTGFVGGLETYDEVIAWVKLVLHMNGFEARFVEEAHEPEADTVFTRNGLFDSRRAALCTATNTYLGFVDEAGVDFL